jgi:hypothetical protein
MDRMVVSWSWMRWSNSRTPPLLPDHASLHTHNATPDALYIVIVKDFVQPVHLSVCSALSSDHLPILIDITCRSSFQNLLDRPDITRMDWGSFQACVKGRLPGNPVVNDKCVEKLTSAIQETTATSVPKRRPRDDPRPPLSASPQDEIRLKKRLRGTGKSPGTPL